MNFRKPTSVQFNLKPNNNFQLGFNRNQRQRQLNNQYAYNKNMSPDVNQRYYRTERFPKETLSQNNLQFTYHESSPTRNINQFKSKILKQDATELKIKQLQRQLMEFKITNKNLLEQNAQLKSQLVNSEKKCKCRKELKNRKCSEQTHISINQLKPRFTVSNCESIESINCNPQALPAIQISLFNNNRKTQQSIEDKNSFHNFGHIVNKCLKSNSKTDNSGVFQQLDSKEIIYKSGHSRYASQSFQDSIYESFIDKLKQHTEQ